MRVCHDDVVKVIVTKRTHHRILDIARRGTKRQRAKYRNAYTTICRNGYIVGIHYGYEVAEPRSEKRFERAERRRGVPTPLFDNGPVEPAWHGITGRCGLFWTITRRGDDRGRAGSAGDLPSDDGRYVWVGRDDWK